jgi:hypothetical protein
MIFEGLCRPLFHGRMVVGWTNNKSHAANEVQTNLVRFITLRIVMHVDICTYAEEIHFLWLVEFYANTALVNFIVQKHPFN